MIHFLYLIKLANKGWGITFVYVIELNKGADILSTFFMFKKENKDRGITFYI